jgi:hypothetical protein
MSTPPRCQASKHCETQTRTQVLTLLEEGYSQRQISCRTGVPQGTIARRNKNRNLMQRNNFRTGCPKKLTKHDIRRLIDILRSGWEGRNFSWGKLAKNLVFMYLPKRLNEHLIWKDIIGVGLAKSHFINRETQHARKLYAIIHLHKLVEFWRSHMYSDECSFDTSARGTTWVTRLRHERYHDHCIYHDFQSGRAR